jgi:hypothetical protein
MLFFAIDSGGLHCESAIATLETRDRTRWFIRTIHFVPGSLAADHLWFRHGFASLPQTSTWNLR